MRRIPATILVLLVMLCASFAVEPRLARTAPIPDSVSSPINTEAGALSRGARRGEVIGRDGWRSGKTFRAHAGSMIGLSARHWRWNPLLRYGSLISPASASAPFVQSIFLSTPSLRAPPRG